MKNSRADLSVLVADDSQVSRQSVQDALAAEQYRVLVAVSGREALDLFAIHRPAVVITDWLMPDVTGLELCQSIREQCSDSYAYIILLTVLTDKSKVVKGLEAGADDYLTKPFHPEELLARVRSGLRIVNLQRQLEAKNRRLGEMARDDALTGLLNRRAILERAASQLHGAKRYDHSLWVVMADLDHFKSVNDTHGHDAGDEVLKTFADILNANIRQSDSCGRLGGEEFLLVMTHLRVDGLRIVVERIRQQFALQRFNSNGESFVVTASFGAAMACGETRDLRRLLMQADTALYAAKRSGRNRMEIAT
jgi:diguanylate cyclase (GGDEF)-like protein